MQNPLEDELWNRYERIAGIDEAGRGPICGPMSVALVILPRGYQSLEINDSKKLTARKREILARTIKEDAIYWRVILVDEREIDDLNIYQAARKGMIELASQCNADWILSDAMPLNDSLPYEAIIKGDAKSLNIAAASILAKTTRDRYMEQLDNYFPLYGLRNHKGYPTRKHLEVISQYPILPFYRKSYGPVTRALSEQKQGSLFDEPDQIDPD